MADQEAQDTWVKRVLGLSVAAPPPDVLIARLEALQPAYLRIMKLDPPERTKLSASMALATELVEGGNGLKAAQVLDRLEKLIGAGGAPAKPVIQTTAEQVIQLTASPGQLVAYRKGLLQWEAARKQARAQLDGLKAEIAKTAPTLARPAAMVGDVMNRLDDQLSDAIDAAMNAKDDNVRAACHRRAADLARSYLMRITGDPVFAFVDKNQVKPLTLRAVLGSALKDLVAALPV